MDRKGDTQQVLTYITIVIVIGFVVVFGVRAIYQFTGTGQESQTSLMTQRLKGDLEGLESSVEATRIKEYPFLSSVNLVCMKSESAPIAGSPENGVCPDLNDYQAMIVDQYFKDNRNNLLVVSDDVYYAFQVPPLQLSDPTQASLPCPFICFKPLNGLIKLRFEKTADYIGVTRVS